ncbi:MULTISPECIES: cell division protein FtsL [Chromohalobacter]|uniref:Cell division protein FtsL n=1 Tax=Chromohalobacter israelensis (strain ATCC BAA-138 / DSM 3043 / CIP 106854 / NCIMB 13768 / 1H11) TaxID=290398 RepID=Q1QVG0_CHRI1|nr:cell division protein FtsL [Chromohalobacter salexigens]ABE59548.1 Cell division protein, FtsL -like protein [Chromohalobacter salexigens DSM 3043]MBZ5874682.1 cell division protein FtsL [Chromohalobacter salexigens]MDO0946307.1 cell division protein FtsL [Chromohalobacter salexigens]PWW41880.1 cell division protein FtsL [Chromohalobacter salexigens]RXE48628.1 cell division protein FtsL [Chromohalobacter salexigens]
MAAQGRHTAPRFRWPFAKRLRWSHIVLAGLVAVLLITALASVASTHLTRVQYARFQQLESERDRLQTAWGRLLLEESTWSAPARVEEVATERLEMRVPDVNDVEVIRR